MANLLMALLWGCRPELARWEGCLEEGSVLVFDPSFGGQKSSAGEGRVLTVWTEWAKPPIVTIHGRTAGLAVELPKGAGVGRYDLALIGHDYQLDRWHSSEARGIVDLLQLGEREAVFSVELTADRDGELESLSGVVRVRRGLGPYCKPMP